MATDDTSILYQDSARLEAEQEAVEFGEREFDSLAHQLMSGGSASGTSTGFDGLPPVPLPGAAEEEFPQETQGSSKAPSEEADPTASLTDDLRQIRNAPVRAAARTADTLMFLATDALEYLGFDADDFERDAHGNRIPLFRTLLDEAAGTAKTGVGQVAQEISTELAGLATGYRFAQGASWVHKAFTIPAATAGLLHGADLAGESTISDTLVRVGGENPLLNNPVTRFFSTDIDDSTAERLAKNFAEDLLLGGLLEGAGKLTSLLMEARRAKKASAQILEDAAEAGIRTADDPVADAALKAQAARAEADFLEEATRAIDDAGADEVAQEAAEVAAFRGDAVAEEALDPRAAQLAEGIRGKAAAARQAAEEAEEALARAAESSEAPNLYLEAYRQQVRPRNADVDARMARAADNAPDLPAPPARVPVDEHLTIDSERLALLRRHIEAGDGDAMIDDLAHAYDAINYNNIADGDGITSLVRATAKLLGDSPGSMRVNGVETMAEFEEQALEKIARTAEIYGGDPTRMLAAMAEDLPNLDGIAARLNAFRMTVYGLARKVQLLGEKFRNAPEAWTELDRVELHRWMVALANGVDRLAGFSSGSGRLLNAHKYEVNSSPLLDILGSSRDLRGAQIREAINAAGGAQNIDRLAEVVSAMGSLDDLSRLAPNVLQGTTVTDILHNMFVANLLSGLGTHTVNLAGGIVRAGLWDVGEEIFSTGARAISGDRGAWKDLMHYFQGAGYGAWAAIRSVDGIADGGIARSVRRGRRQTGAGSRKFADSPIALSNRAQFAQSLREGLPLMRRPAILGRLFGQQGGGMLKLFPAKQATRNRVADYVASRTGFAAQAFDYLGRIYELPFRALVGGDELVASISYNARLYSDTMREAQARGLRGQELLDQVARYRSDVANLPVLKRRFEELAAEGIQDSALLARIQSADALTTRATRQAQRATYTEPPDKISRVLLKAKDTFPFLRWNLPFITTPVQLVEASIGASPIGAMARTFDAIGAIRAGDTLAAQEAAGKAAFILGFNWAVYEGIQSGRIVGGGPVSPGERAVWESDEANVPYSIAIGGKRFKIDRLDPFAMTIFGLADMMDIWTRRNDPETENAALEMYKAMSNMLQSRTYLSGLTTVMNLVENGTGAAMRHFVVSTTHNTTIPLSRFWAGVDKGGLGIPESWVIDPDKTPEDFTTLERWLVGDRRVRITQDHVPAFGDDGFSLDNLVPEGLLLQLGASIGKDLPAGFEEEFMAAWQKLISIELQDNHTARDFFGEPRTYPAGLGPAAINAFGVRDVAEKDPLVTELVRLGFRSSVNQQFGEIDGVPLSPGQQARFQELIRKPTPDSKPFRDLLRDAIFEEDGTTFKPSYDALGYPVGDDFNGGRVRVVAPLVESRRAAARGIMLSEDAELRKLVIERKRNEARAMTREGSEALSRGEVSPPSRISNDPLADALDLE